MNNLKKYYLNLLSSQEKEQVIKDIRDLTVLEINQDTKLIFAVDSDGGIGSKELDAVQVDNELLGYFAARVPLFEIIAANSRPLFVIDALCVEMENFGEKIIAGIKKACSRAGFPGLYITGSTEENVPTRQTGVGLTAAGVITGADWTIGSSQRGDILGLAGVPKSAPEDEVRIDDSEIISFADLLKIRESPKVRDVLPVGSKGVKFEIKELCDSADLTYELNSNNKTDSLKLSYSAGPATCLVFTAADKNTAVNLNNQLQAPVTVLGRIK